MDIVENCQRCGKEITAHTMSMFNKELICMGCKEVEKNHPDYDKARRKELEEVMKGNYNYEGIGKPADL